MTKNAERGTRNAEIQTPAGRGRLVPVSVFWREEPLTEAENQLYRALRKAHRRSVFRGNVSSVNLLNTFAASRQFSNALMAALASMGGPHAPLEQTMHFLSAPDLTAETEALLEHGRMVPGWGNSFVKGRKDDIWLHVDALLKSDFPQMSERLERVTAALKGKNLFPNPSAYTAATALLLRMPPALAPYLFVAGRLDGWAEHIFKTFFCAAPGVSQLSTQNSQPNP